MQDKTKNKIIAIGFISILIIIFFINLFTEDKQISVAERRKLAMLPKINIENIINGKVTKDFEKYVVDQFIARDFFRSVKSFNSTKIFKQKDNNKLFEKDGVIYKIEYPLNENNIKKSANKINEVFDRYLKNNNNVYYSIIPDKNYYLENDDHLKIDYNKLKEIMQNEIKNMQYIDIYNALTLEDYYKTDIHWKQENLLKVVNVLKNEMKLNTTEQIKYETKEVGDFYGVYYGQLAKKMEPDKMYIVTNKNIENCTTYNYETKTLGKIYYTKISSDKYDIYLSGATPLITIENPNAKEKRELLLFRDSFGSSLAPLLVENYSKITLIDLRYISSKLLDKYIEFENQDVLFLYSSVVLNQNILK